MAAPKLPDDPVLQNLRRAPHDFDLDKLDEAQLISLYSKLMQRLPRRRLKDINLEQELVLQLLTVQNLQSDALDNEGVPAHQKAQIAGKVADALAVLGKLQIAVHSSERLKRIESVLIATLKELPDEAQEKFLAAYEAALEDAGA